MALGASLAAMHAQAVRRRVCSRGTCALRPYNVGIPVPSSSFPIPVLVLTLVSSFLSLLPSVLARMGALHSSCLIDPSPKDAVVKQPRHGPMGFSFEFSCLRDPSSEDEQTRQVAQDSDTSTSTSDFSAPSLLTPAPVLEPNFVPDIDPDDVPIPRGPSQPTSQPPENIDPQPDQTADPPKPGEVKERRGRP